MRLPRPRLLLALFLLAAGSVPAAAHELGTIRTTVLFRRDGTYRAEVIIDREHLPSGFTRGAPTPAPRWIRGWTPGAGPAVGSILARVASASKIVFDGRLARPSVEWVEPDRAAAELTLRFSGAIPAGAQTFTWSNSLPLGTYLLTLSTEGEESPSRQWLEGGEAAAPFRLDARVAPPATREVLRQYLVLGYTHILPKGTDHILFVLGIFLLNLRWRPVLLQVTAFTLAHTITLALTIYGVVSLPARVVEPLIAISIVYVAVENLFTSELNRWRVALVFAFGLVHGMGFAGVLSDLGLPRSQFLPALVSFNVGVEMGQLTVILLLLITVGLPFGGRPWYRRRVVAPLSIAIAAVGLYWAVTRALG